MIFFSTDQFYVDVDVFYSTFTVSNTTNVQQSFLLIMYIYKTKETKDGFISFFE